MDISDIFWTFLLKPPQPFIGLFFGFQIIQVVFWMIIVYLLGRQLVLNVTKV